MAEHRKETLFAVHLHRKPPAADWPDELCGAESHAEAVWTMLEIAEDHGVLPEEHQITTIDDFWTATHIDLGSSEAILLRSDEYYVSRVESTDEEEADGKLEFWLTDHDDPEVESRRPVLVEFRFEPE